MQHILGTRGEEKMREEGGIFWGRPAMERRHMGGN